METSAIIKEIHLKKWEEFKRVVTSFPSVFIFRGHASAAWNLSSSFERSDLFSIHNVEKTILKRFQQASILIEDQGEKPASLLDWFALIQHYGTPTRLIDFTVSPYVAAFFAFRETANDSSEDVAIWCLNKVRYYQGAIYYLERNNIEVSDLLSTDYIFGEKVFSRIYDKDQLDCVMPFEVQRPNRRYLAQQAVFLFPLNIDRPFVDQLEFVAYQEDHRLTKITLPKTERNRALRDLLKMNVSPATLFPGIEGYAQTINLTYDVMETVDEWVENHSEVRQDGFHL